MNFPLSVEKTIQAIGVLFRHDGVSHMNYMRLLKLLYLADRESIQETGRAITGGPVVAMERGPVLEEVYHLIRGQHQEMPIWDHFLRTSKYTLHLVNDPDVRKLSKYEIKKLQEVAARHESDDEWVLSNLTHQLPEWSKNDPGASCKRIPLSDILEAVGRSASSAEIAADIQHLSKMDGTFGRAR